MKRAGVFSPHLVHGCNGDTKLAHLIEDRSKRGLAAVMPVAQLHGKPPPDLPRRC